MKKLYKFFAGFIILCVCSISLKAQIEKEKEICPEPDFDAAYYGKFLQARKNNFAGLTSSGPHQLRIFFHIVTDDDGSEPGATPAYISQDLDTMQAVFSAGHICFVYAGLNYVASTTLNHIDILANKSVSRKLFDAWAVPECINIFYVYEIKGSNPNSGGNIAGYTLERALTVIEKGTSYYNPSHEMGHCLGLLHTFDTRNGTEYIDKTGCLLRGDLMCETDADPFSYNSKDCFSTDKITGEYNGTCEDLHHDTDFSPPYHNIMSYWKIDPRSFTGDQLDEANYKIENNDTLQNASSQNDVVITASQYKKGYVYRSAINSLSTSGDVEFTGSVKAGLFGNSVILKPGFDAHAVNDSVIIHATECKSAGFTTTTNESASSQELNTRKTQTDLLNDHLLIYPNPSTGYFNIQYSRATAFDAFITVRNTNGSVVFSATRKNIFKLLEKIEPGTNARGVYFIEVYINGKRLTAKAVMQ